MRTILVAAACALNALNAARAQNATVVAQVVAREGGGSLGFTTVAVLSQGIQRLTTESGVIVLQNLSPGAVRLRFRRIGFAPTDTTFTAAANDTVRIRIEMTRLVLQLPAVAISGTCTDRMPFEEKPAILAELFDQVRQNAERLRLLATEKPFVIQTVAVGGIRNRDNKIIGAARVDTVERGPLPPKPYVPRGVFFRIGEGPFKGEWGVQLPELPDLADTAFTNNHCLWYAGQERFESDSVIRVDFEPVSWLAKEVDLEGSIYLRVDGYQIVGLVTRLSRIPAQNRALLGYSVRARFTEIVSGVPAIAEWEMINTFRNNGAPYVQTGKLISTKWLDSATAKRDTSRRPPR